MFLALERLKWTKREWAGSTEWASLQLQSRRGMASNPCTPALTLLRHPHTPSPRATTTRRNPATPKSWSGLSGTGTHLLQLSRLRFILIRNIKYIKIYKFSFNIFISEVWTWTKRWLLLQGKIKLPIQVCLRAKPTHEQV